VSIALSELPKDIDTCHSLIQEMHADLEQAQIAMQEMNTKLEQTQITAQEMHSAFQQMHTQLQQSNEDIELLKQQIQYLVRARFGRKSERIDSNPDQLRIFTLPAETLPGPTLEEKPAAILQHRKGHGRKKRELPRIRHEYSLPQAELVCKCCNGQLNKIGEEISEQLEYVPASLHIIEHVRFKYACPQCAENVAIAPKPQQPIDKGLPGPGLLAYVATSKYGDHLPLHRLEHIFKRQGAEIRRSTMCDWMTATSLLLEPMWNIMKESLLKSAVIHTDDTILPVLDKNLKKARSSRIWVYIGDKDNPFVLFDYTRSWGRDGPKNFLNGFSGYLQADGFNGYDCIYASELVKEVACWAHARRYFFDALKSASTQANFAIAEIKKLYAIENEIKELEPEERLEARKNRSRPVLDEIKKWLDEQKLYALPKSFIAKAINYSLNNWEALCRYTEDERLNIDNNTSERAIRPVVIGRKNWLFAGSDKGGRMAAVLNSIVATCQRHKIDPQAYLADVLPKLPGASHEDMFAMLPGTWSPQSVA
jgi:transposase